MRTMYCLRASPDLNVALRFLKHHGTPECDGDLYVNRSTQKLRIGVGLVALCYLSVNGNLVVSRPGPKFLTEGVEAIIDRVFSRCEGVDMSLWRPAGVEEEPHVQLRNWAVFKLDGSDIHVAGEVDGREGGGRTSSKMVEFDAATGTGTTTSGRKYQLTGQRGLQGDGLYVWRHWCAYNAPVSVEDITDTVLIATRVK